MTPNPIPLLLALIVSIAVTSSHASPDVVRMLHINTTNSTYMSLLLELEIRFENLNPEIDVQIEAMTDTSLKASRERMLITGQSPDIIYSWGGGDFQRFARQGYLEDLSGKVTNIESALHNGASSAFRVDGIRYGLPSNLSQVGIWYNRRLLAAAGVDPSDLSSWSGFLDAIQRLKDAGITPIAVGGKDKWPVHFYWSYLAMRQGGQKLFESVTSNQKSWCNADYVKASQYLLQLAALEPFQSDFENHGYLEAATLFGNHQAAMHLMGDWDIDTQRRMSETQKGVTDRDLGFAAFPTVPRGKGQATDTLGGTSGWIIPAGRANDATLKWLEFLMSHDVQSREAKMNISLPVLVSATQSVRTDIRKALAQSITQSRWHQVFWDQALGSRVGSTLNDISLDLITQNSTPRESCQQLQTAWAQR